MAPNFLNDFRRASSLVQDDEVRGKLQRAILNDDSAAFQAVLRSAYPALVDQHRLYGVLVMTPEGMQSIMVDEMGHRIEPGYTIAAETPIDLLNVHYGETEMTVKTDDGIWKAPYSKPA